MKEEEKVSITPPDIFEEEEDMVDFVDDNGLDEPESDYCQWSNVNNYFFPTTKTSKIIPSGYYNVKYLNTHNTWSLKFNFLNNDEKIIDLPDQTFNEIISDINTFWESKEKYESFRFIFKRGILLYGPPGCGKSTIISLIIKKVINDHKGIVIQIGNIDELSACQNIIQDMRSFEPDRKIFIILEDVDAYLELNKSNLSILLNFLDGTLKINNLLILATTNLPEKLTENIVSRPTRFDRNFLIDLPTRDCRKAYFESFVSKKSLKEKNITIDQLLNNTEGFSIDHMKELILLTFVQNKPLQEATSEIKTMSTNPTIRNVTILNSERNKNSKKMGFKK